MASVTAKIPDSTDVGYQFVVVYKWGNDTVSAHYNKPFCNHGKEIFLDITPTEADFISWIMQKHPRAEIIGSTFVNSGAWYREHHPVESRQIKCVKL